MKPPCSACMCELRVFVCERERERERERMCHPTNCVLILLSHPHLAHPTASITPTRIAPTRIASSHCVHHSHYSAFIASSHCVHCFHCANQRYEFLSTEQGWAVAALKAGGCFPLEGAMEGAAIAVQPLPTGSGQPRPSPPHGLFAPVDPSLDATIRASPQVCYDIFSLKNYIQCEYFAKLNRYRYGLPLRSAPSPQVKI